MNPETALFYKCGKCNKYVITNHPSDIEQVKSLAINPIDNAPIVLHNEISNVELSFLKQSKDFQVLIKKNIVMLCFLGIAIVTYLFLLNNPFILIITTILFGYLFFQLFSLFKSHKRFIEKKISFNPHIEEVNINLFQNKIVKCNLLPILYENVKCEGCVQELKDQHNPEID